MAKNVTNYKRLALAWRRTAPMAQVFVGLVVVLGTSYCAADPITVPLSGTLENYFVAANAGSKDTVARSMSYLTAQALLTSSLSVTVGALNYGDSDVLNYEPSGTISYGATGTPQYGNRTVLDENYVQMDSGDTRLRVGRFRSEFGFSEWSDQYYLGFIEPPLIRYDYIGPNLSLTRVDSGLEWQQTSGPTQVTMALIDAKSGGYQLLPESLNHADIRVQRLVGSFILGANGLIDTDGSNNAYGVDARWTSPHWQVRGEYDRGSSAKPVASGYYVDVLFHPAGLLRTTFVGRAEGVYNVQGLWDSTPFGMWSVSGHQYTIGVKQILNPTFTAELSRFYGDGEARTAPDWALQLVAYARF